MLFLAARTLSAVLGKLGHPGAALDDAYIHFQYARALAEGHPLRFQPGEPISSGATSVLWPIVLAPFWALGAKGNAILWPAWFFSFCALGALSWEAAQLTQKLAGRAAAAGAAALVLAFGGFLWFAASGMEVVPFAWAIARGSRRASEWAEKDGSERTPRRAVELTALAWVAALLRPEGAITALLVGATLVGFPGAATARPTARPPKAAWSTRTKAAWSTRTKTAWSSTTTPRAMGLLSIVAAFATPLLLWILTGSFRSNTAVAKLLPGNPYYVGPGLVDAVVRQAKLLVDTLLNGEIWSAEFLPPGGAPIAIAGLGAIGVCGWRMHARWRAAMVLALAVTMFVPCAYSTFLCNRLRYIWPFATGWIVGLACLARIAGDAAGLVRARWRLATPLVCGLFVGLFASKLPFVIQDVAQSASGIDRQQVSLGRWANEALPAGARIGVNDTGAIAYFGERTTFDVVGLTTNGEARYWVAGAGSRLEHYERLLRSEPWKLPTHFIVYPEWMAMPMVLGVPLKQAVVTDATILGGQTMRAYVADWSALGSGEDPWTPGIGEADGASAGAPRRGLPLIDAVDVADLESEAEHAYELLGARDGEEVAFAGTSPEGATVVDGGRSRRTRERFVARLRPGLASHCIVRLAATRRTSVLALAGGEPAGAFDVGEDAEDDDDHWVERSFDVPAAVAAPRTPIELRAAPEAITTFHYWCYAGESP
ncbi:MAG TPA: hypothetical protein VMT47_17275 [Polyangia bacterium]|nr:hypothetical protein [Polyangia bacterium]